MSEQTHEVLESFPFESRDERKCGAFEIVKRTVKFEDGNVRHYIERRLRVGERYLVLPRDGEEAIIQAIRSGFPQGDVHYAALMEQINQNRPAGGFRDDSRGRGGDRRSGGGRDSRGKKERYNYED